MCRAFRVAVSIAKEKDMRKKITLFRLILERFGGLILIPTLLMFSLGIAVMQNSFTQRQLELYSETTDYLAQLCDDLFYNIKTKVLFLYNDTEIMEILNNSKKENSKNNMNLTSKISSMFYSIPDVDSLSLYWYDRQTIIYRKQNSSSRFYKISDEKELSTYFLHDFPKERYGYDITALPAAGKSTNAQIVLDQNLFTYTMNPLARLEIIFNNSIFSRIFEGIQEEGDVMNLVLDSNHTFLYCNQEVSLTAEDKNALWQPDSSKSETMTIGGASYYLFRRYLPLYDISIIKCVPYAYIHSLYSPYMNILLVIALAVLGFLSLLTVSVSKAVSKPIRSLIDTINQFRHSVQPVSIPAETRILEISELNDDFNAMFQEINSLIDEKIQYEVKQKQAQMDMLMVRVNPHFLYNALQTLQYMAIKRNAPDINAMVVSLSKILQYNLAWNEKTCLLGDEFGICQQYLTIQKYRYLSELTLNLEAPPVLPAVVIPKMTLQPIIENSFMHGFKNKKGDYFISIRIEAEESGAFTITVSDNGTGMTNEQMEHLNRQLEARALDFDNIHSGLMSANYRLGQMYPGSRIRVSSDGTHFIVTIQAKGALHESLDH